jgi:hypothetical protein
VADPDLKEFFYVDVDRTRSLLAQLQGGIVDAITSEAANTVEANATASFFGIGGQGGYARETRSHESRSFQEMVFVAFEALADKRELISDLDEGFTHSDKWSDGTVHSALSEGQLIRLQCDVQTLDGGLFGERIARFEKMARAILGISGQRTAKHSTPAQRAQLSNAALAAVMGGMTPDQLEAMTGFVDAFVGEGIAFRALPCGKDDATSGFAGALLGRREYIQEERESLFSRYGVTASSWTCVMQIAAIPAMPQAASAVDGSEIEETETETGLDAPDDDSGIDRAAMERLAVELLDMMEKIGIVEGPRWPTISVTPLAVYRTVPQPG